MSDDPPPAGDATGPTRRRALMLGAAGASAIVSIRPALAQAAVSISNCEIRVPDAGRAGAADIDAALQADNTEHGAISASSARAAIPTPEAKAETWRAVVEEGTMPNSLQAAAIAGSLVRVLVDRASDTRVAE